MVFDKNLSDLVNRLQKRKYLYSYCHPEWIEDLSNSSKTQAHIHFARKNNLQIETLDAVVQQKYHSKIGLHDCNGAYSGLLNLSTNALEYYLMAFSGYVFFQLQALKYIAAPQYEKTLKKSTDLLEIQFSKSGIMYKNTLNPAYKSLAQVYSMVLRKAEFIQTNQMIQFGLFCVQNLLQKKVSAEFTTILQLSLPQQASAFPHFSLDEVHTINSKQLELLIKYIATLTEENSYGSTA